MLFAAGCGIVLLLWTAAKYSGDVGTESPGLSGVHMRYWPGERFIVGVSEDIGGNGKETLVALAETVCEHGRTPIEP